MGGQAFTRAPQTGSQSAEHRFGIVAKLPAGDRNHGHAVRAECRHLEPIPVESQAAGMRVVAVDLNRKTGLAP
jgi:hypothetical protein